jgi:hypothetical protein
MINANCKTGDGIAGLQLQMAAGVVGRRVVYKAKPPLL